MKSKIEGENEKQHAVRMRTEVAEFQNKRLLEENKLLLEGIDELKDNVKRLELEIQRREGIIQNLEEALVKEQTHVKTAQKQLEQFRVEVQDHQQSKEDFKNVVELRRKEQINANQRFIREIDTLQNQVEQVYHDF